MWPNLPILHYCKTIKFSGQNIYNFNTAVLVLGTSPCFGWLFLSEPSATTPLQVPPLLPGLRGRGTLGLVGVALASLHVPVDAVA